jgi:hypothetical protein
MFGDARTEEQYRVFVNNFVDENSEVAADFDFLDAMIVRPERCLEETCLTAINLDDNCCNPRP